MTQCSDADLRFCFGRGCARGLWSQWDASTAQMDAVWPWQRAPVAAVAVTETSAGGVGGLDIRPATVTCRSRYDHQRCYCLHILPREFRLADAQTIAQGAVVPPPPPPPGKFLTFCFRCGQGGSDGSPDRGMMLPMAPRMSQRPEMNAGLLKALLCAALYPQVSIFNDFALRRHSIE